MPIEQIANIVRGQLNDGEAHSLPEIVEQTLKNAPAGVYSDDVKFVVFGLVQNKEVVMTNDFKVRRNAGSRPTRSTF
jgi:hypothetical protein